MAAGQGIHDPSPSLLEGIKQELARSFEIKSIKQEWLVDCLKNLSKDTNNHNNDFRQQNNKQQSAKVWERYLNEDIKITSNPSLPSNVGQMNDVILKGSFVLQASGLVDVSEPNESRLNTYGVLVAGVASMKRPGKTKVGDTTTGGNNGGNQLPPTEARRANRALKLLLTDGTLFVSGFEYRSIPQLSILQSQPGVKLIITDCKVMRGLLLLSTQNVRVLGGSVEQLIKLRDIHLQILADPSSADSLRQELQTLSSSTSTSSSSSTSSSTSTSTSSSTSSSSSNSSTFPPLPSSSYTRPSQPSSSSSSSVSSSSSFSSWPSSRPSTSSLSSSTYFSTATPPTTNGHSTTSASNYAASSSSSSTTSSSSFPSPPPSSTLPSSASSSSSSSASSSLSFPAKRPLSDTLSSPTPYSSTSPSVSTYSRQKLTTNGVGDTSFTIAPSVLEPISEPEVVHLQDMMTWVDREELVRVRAAIVEVLPPFRFSLGEYSLLVKIDDGTEVVQAELGNLVIEEMLGLSCPQFQQLWDKQRLIAKQRTRQMETTLWKAEGILELHITPDSVPKIVSISPPLLSDAEYLLAKLKESPYFNRSGLTVVRLKNSDDTCSPLPTKARKNTHWIEDDLD